MFTLILILKITLQFLAVASALLAYRLDYVIADKRSTKFRLWRKRLFVCSVCFLFTSIAVTIIDSFENEKKENALKSQITRAVNPIRDIAISCKLSTSLKNTPGDAYRTRIEKAIFELSKEKKGLWAMGLPMSNKGCIEQIRITKPPYTPDFEKEHAVYNAINFLSLMIEFHKKPVPVESLIDKKADPDLLILVMGIADYVSPTVKPFQGSMLNLVYELQDRLFTVVAQYLPPVPFSGKSTGKIISIPDLSGTQMVIRMGGFGTDKPSLTLAINEIRRSMDLKTFSVKISGREIKVKRAELGKFTDCDGNIIFVHQIPADFQ